MSKKTDEPVTENNAVDQSIPDNILNIAITVKRGAEGRTLEYNFNLDDLASLVANKGGEYANKEFNKVVDSKLVAELKQSIAEKLQR